MVLKYDEILALDDSNHEILSKKTAVQEKIDYFSNVVVYDFSSKYYQQYFSGKVPGVVFKIKNNGDRELKKIQLTVYFKDNMDKVIHEDIFTPISEFSWQNNSQLLKPNRIWQLEEGYYLKAENVPSEWKEGSAYIMVTDIEFN